MENYASKLAKIITEHSLNIQPKDKVLIDVSNFIPNELTFEIYKLCIQKGAFPYLDVMGLTYTNMRSDSGGFMKFFLENASEAQLNEPLEIMKYKINWADKFVRIVSIDNPTFLSGVSQDKLMQWQNNFYPNIHKMIEKPWLLTYFPTKGTAKLANMSLKAFTKYYYDATVVDYAKQSKEILRIQDKLDKANIVEIKGKNIDLKLDITGRLAAGADTGMHNIPDGESFIAPLENKTSGYVHFEYPQIYQGNEVSDIHLEFDKGRVVKYSAKKGFKVLEKILESHKGNKIIGELGIGCNKNIKKYIKQIIYDEKIYGTVHFALGSSYESIRGGGKNKGTVHWDMIKDLRTKGSHIKLDGKLLQADGIFV